MRSRPPKGTHSTRWEAEGAGQYFCPVEVCKAHLGMALSPWGMSFGQAPAPQMEVVVRSIAAQKHSVWQLGQRLLLGYQTLDNLLLQQPMSNTKAS